jgi:hypothetical protein
VSPQAAPPVDAAALSRQVQDLTTQLSEQTKALQFWYEKAKAQPVGAAPAVAPEPEPEPDVLDVVTTKGAKGLDELLAKRGYVKREELETAIESKVQHVTSATDLVKRYPDLNDEKSEFFQTTAREYGRLKKSGVNDAEAMSMAADRTALALINAGKMKTPAQRDADDKAAREQDRLARIRAQGGEGGGARPSGGGEDDDLTPEQKAIAVKMLADEDTTAEQAIERYKQRAKKGVAIKGGFR